MQAKVALQGEENNVRVNKTNFNQRLVSKGPLSLASKSIFLISRQCQFSLSEKE